MCKKGISLFSIEKFLSHSADKIRRGTLLCFKKILLSKIFMYWRGGGHPGFVEIFLPHGTKNFVSEPFWVSENFWYGKKIMDKLGEGGITIFCRNCFVSVPKNFVGEPFLVSKKLWPRNFSCIKGRYYDFLSF